MNPMSLNSLLPMTPANAEGTGMAAPGAGVTTGAAGQAPDALNTAVSAFAALLQTTLGEVGADGATPTSTAVMGLSDAAAALPETLLADGALLPESGKPLPVEAAVVLPGMAALPKAAAAQLADDAASGGLPALDSADLLATDDADALLPALKDGQRLDGEFARLIAQSRLVAVDTTQPASISSTAVAANQVATLSALSDARPGETTAMHRSFSIDVPLQQSDWNNAFANRISWLANNQIQSADIRLNPQNLGSIEIKIRMDGDQAQVIFGAAHASVRDAIESALPRLREMFAEQGLQLADVNVGLSNGGEQRDAGAGAEQARRGQGYGTSEHEFDEQAAIVSSASGLKLGSGLVDIFA